METDRKALIPNLRLLDVSFKMDAALIIIEPVDLVELQVWASVIYRPLIVKPGGGT